MIIEIDNLPAEHQSMVIQFILDNQSKSIDFWGYPSKIFKDYTVPAWSLINGKLYNKEMKIEEYRAGNEEIAFITGFLLTEEFRQAILDLKEIELIEKDCN
jgi:hypothetical protein